MLKLILATAIMLIIFNRLLSVLGSTKAANELGTKDPKRAVDVTGTGHNLPSVDHKLIVESEKGRVLENLKVLCEKMDTFSLPAFVKGARKAISLAIEATKSGDEKTMSSLTDPGLVQLLQNIKHRFNDASGTQGMGAKVCRVQMFNNKAFITLSVEKPNSQWTFSKHIKQQDPRWYISDVSAL
jgi:predicted lipid-binding transport protein (Tim44 family)